MNEIKYDEAIKKNKILATDAVGRMLEAQKKIDPVMQQEWKQALKGGQEGMQLQRMKWAIDRRDAYKTIRVRRVEEEFQDKDGGKYKPFAKIAQDEGGDYSAYVAACNVVKNCLNLYKQGKTIRGKPFVKWNGQTERSEFLHLESGFDDIVRDVQGWLDS